MAVPLPIRSIAQGAVSDDYVAFVEGALFHFGWKHTKPIVLFPIRCKLAELIPALSSISLRRLIDRI
ncbi:hypothetical protein [Labrys wisconsinensis]|uniref:Uncharacterized protein n=1 Tax=Labrys wisconsinensis TaxID=425677 RepID=A0ABU0J7I0_9HYPH|nr:hypothetical protein [Labrys wisconsinensis]MDQ0470231.1 hypothetical protein [Labrys wisconsinensis]